MILATGILLLRKESSMILARFFLFLIFLDRLFPPLKKLQTIS